MKRTLLFGIILAAIVIIAVGAYVGLYYLPSSNPPSEAMQVALIGTGSEMDTYWMAASFGLDEAVMALNSSTNPIKISKTFLVSPADFRRVAEAYATQGFDLIICPDVGYETAVVSELSTQYPNVNFLGGGGWSNNSIKDNIEIYGWDIWKGYYLAGIIAGSVTNSSIIGWVSAFEFPDAARIYNMLLEGAKQVNPNIRGKYIFTGDWHDPVKGSSAASALINDGADVVLASGNGMTDGVIKECERRGKYTVGYSWDQNGLAPSFVLTSVLQRTHPYYINAIQRIREGTFGNMYWSLGIKEDVIALAPYHSLENAIPLSARNLVSQVITDSTAGTFNLPEVSGQMPAQG